MATDRRSFLRFAGLVGFSAATGAPASVGRLLSRASDERFFDWTEVARGVHVATGQGGNALAARGLLVDCKNAPFGEVLGREARALAGVIDRVVNTHHHADHTGGNHAFIKDVGVWSHENAHPRVVLQTDRYLSQIKQAVIDLERVDERKKALIVEDWKRLHDRMSDLRAADFTPAGKVIDGEEWDLRGTRVTFHHLGPGHTDNAIVVRMGSVDVVHTGDLVFAGRHPFIDTQGGGSVRGWEASLRLLRELCGPKTVVVPGHGDVGDAGLVARQSAYFESLRRIVSRARDHDGMSRAEVVKLQTGAFEGLAGGEQALARNLGAMFDELADEAR